MHLRGSKGADWSPMCSRLSTSGFVLRHVQQAGRDKQVQRACTVRYLVLHGLSIRPCIPLAPEAPAIHSNTTEYSMMVPEHRLDRRWPYLPPPARIDISPNASRPQS